MDTADERQSPQDVQNGPHAEGEPRRAFDVGGEAQRGREYIADGVRRAQGFGDEPQNYQSKELPRRVSRAWYSMLSWETGNLLMS